MANTDSESQATPKEKSPKGWHQFWQKEYDAAEKRVRKFQKQGNKVVKRYLDEREGNAISESNEQRSKLNLFHKNTNTLMNMLYGQTPRSDVSREHQDPDDDVARVASVMLKRILDADYQPSGEDVSTALKCCLQDRLLPGLGIARVRYEFETGQVQTMNPETLQMETTEQVVSEDAPIDYVHWQDVLWGWGRNWNEIPWWGFRAWMTKEEVTERFGEKIANNLEYKNQLPTGSDNRSEDMDRDQKNNVQKAEIWEFWQKHDRKVYWWSQGADLILDIRDDPLELRGFWPIAKPMTANVTTTLYMPRADFVIAQDLYNEIDILQTRISIITEAVKVVGVYDQSASGSVGRMLKEGFENDLIPVENWAMFAEGGGLKGKIDWFPIQDVVQTLQVLAQVQESKITQLNEITGMSEIMRGGAGGQYTAAASNQMAAKMGSIDVQALQDEFARFASDIEALKAEVVAKHFEERTIMRQSSAMFLPEPDKPLIPQAVQLLKNPDCRWRVSIRPESIAMIDYAQLKQERTEFLTAMATYIQSASSAAQAMPGSLPVLMEMLKWGMAGFKGSDYLEGIMDSAIDMAKKAPPQGQDDGKAKEADTKLQTEQMRQQTEQMKIQGDLQKIQAKSQADMQSIQAKIQGEIAKITTDAKRDQSLEDQQSQYGLLEIAKELEAKLTEIAAQTQSALEIERVQGAVDMQVDNNQHGNKIREIRTSGTVSSNNQS